MNRIGNVVALVVGALVGAITCGLLVAALWRAVQFGAWLGAGVPGIITLTVGQLALLVIPSLFGYLQTAEGAWPAWLAGMVVVNTVVGLASSIVQFGNLEGVVSVINAAVPGAAALCLALVMLLVGNRQAQGRWTAEL